jgi:hypothetical protein
MIRKLHLLLLMLLVLGLAGTAPGAIPAEAKGTEVLSKVKYDFDQVKVQYAAEFTAYPAGSGKPPVVTHSVYGSVYGAVYQEGPKPIQVLYGVVTLSGGNGGGVTEQFIKVTEGASSVRALSNGGGWEYYGQEQGNYTQIKAVNTNFVTGKKLEGSSVVKDYSEGWKAINLKRSFDLYQNMTDISISFQWDGKGPSDPFFQRLTQTSYTVDMSTLKHVGNQVVK